MIGLTELQRFILLGLAAGGNEVSIAGERKLSLYLVQRALDSACISLGAATPTHALARAVVYDCITVDDLREAAWSTP